MLSLKWFAGAIALLACFTLGTVAGWRIRSLSADRQIAEIKNAELSELALQQLAAIKRQDDAMQAVARYEAARDKLVPVVLRIHDAAEPIVRVLDTCPLRPDAVGLLYEAANSIDAARGFPVRLPPAQH